MANGIFHKNERNFGASFQILKIFLLICCTTVLPKPGLYGTSISLAFAPKEIYVQTGKIISAHTVRAKVPTSEIYMLLFLIWHYSEPLKLNFVSIAIQMTIK